MKANEIVEAAVAHVVAQHGHTITAALPPETEPWAVRLPVVERIETMLDGHVSTRLGDAYQLRTIGELIGAVERARWARPCVRCGERLPVEGPCMFCETKAGPPAATTSKRRRAPARAEV